jgi:hypothetical protein
VIDLKGSQAAKAKFEKSNSKRDLVRKDTIDKIEDGVATNIPHSRLLGDNLQL